MLLDEQAESRRLLETLVLHLQAFLRWLIDLGLEPDMAKLQAL